MRPEHDVKLFSNVAALSPKPSTYKSSLLIRNTDGLHQR